MTFYDQFDTAQVTAEEVLPEYVNDGPTEISYLSSEDQARMEELDRVGNRNAVIALGGLALQLTGVYQLFKGNQQAGKELAELGTTVWALGSLNTILTSRRRSKIRNS